ncbi:rubrerythrin [uncultured Flavonifractor sp.]|uniref:rubrerythrin n=1 Tax=uncultured Flavonifractor sp. TaxID=1193534 RepID=UPI0026113F8B|nr:rubrerythrin [uncultured Flavonifractor sp.]
MEQTASPGMDREVFERVWRRVMPEDRGDCPFTVPVSEPEADQTGGVPAVPVQLMDLGQVEEGAGLTCLGAAAAPWSTALQGYIDDELSDWRCYQALARRTPGGGGRALAAVAADERRHAKKLSTAYFLISGVRYWPEQKAPQASAPLHAALRDRFWAEQQGAAAYLAAAAETADPCLKELFTELAGEEEAHAWTVRSVLEQL